LPNRFCSVGSMVYSLFTCARNWTDKGVYTILIFFLPRSGFVQLQDKIVVRFALTIYPYSLGLDINGKYVLFLGSKDDNRKNIKLLNKARDLHPDLYAVLCPFPIAHHKVPTFLNACDVLVVTSYNEGSPNVIKEAMACNCPIVSTDVGDVKEIIGNTSGCYVCSFKPKNLSDSIKLSLDFGKRTNGRNKVAHLEESQVAKRITDVYRRVVHGSGT